MPLQITALLACAITTLALILIFRVIGERQASSVNLGDNGVLKLERKIRAHANLMENAPLFVILIGIAELNSGNTTMLAILSTAFVLGRIGHGYAMAFTDKFVAGRLYGMLTSLITTICAVLYNLFLVLV